MEAPVDLVLWKAFNVSMGHQGSYQLCLMQDTGPVDRLFRWVVAHQMEDHLFEVVVVAIRVMPGSWEDALLFESHGIVSVWSRLLVGLDGILVLVVR